VEKRSELYKYKERERGDYEGMEGTDEMVGKERKERKSIEKLSDSKEKGH
jgi:hypothetical protein